MPVIKPFGSTRVTDPMLIARLDGLTVESAEAGGGRRCLTIGVRASSCFNAREIASGQAVITYTRCPTADHGWRIVAGLTPNQTRSASVIANSGTHSAERVSGSAFAFAFVLPNDGPKAPVMIDLHQTGGRTVMIRFPIGPDEHNYCHR